MLIIGKVSDLKINDDFLVEYSENAAVYGKFVSFVDRLLDITPEIRDYLDSSVTSVDDAIENAKRTHYTQTLVIYTENLTDYKHAYLSRDLVAAIRRSI